MRLDAGSAVSIVNLINIGKLISVAAFTNIVSSLKKFFLCFNLSYFQVNLRRVESISSEEEETSNGQFFVNCFKKSRIKC